MPNDRLEVFARSLFLMRLSFVSKGIERETVPICMYCGSSGQKKFPREHVVPYAFGQFKKALTLGCVCAECNQYFCKHLDLRFASESAESIARYKYGLRDMESAKRTRTVRAKANIPGPILGAKAVLRPDASAKSGIGTVFVSQVALKNPTETEWRWYTLQELNSDLMRRIEPGAGLKLFISLDAAEEEDEETVNSRLREEEEKIRSKLREFGFSGPTVQISRDRVLPQKNLRATVTCDFDFNMSRCVAKIAFNYLAYVLEENAALLFRREFDVVRNYVRYGTTSEQPVIYLSKKPNLDHKSGTTFVDGHVVTVAWDATNENIDCYLNLFNAMNYRVAVCRKYEGLWFALQSAHSFDFESGKVMKVPLNLLPAPIKV